MNEGMIFMASIFIDVDAVYTLQNIESMIMKEINLKQRLYLENKEKAGKTSPPYLFYGPLEPQGIHSFAKASCDGLLTSTLKAVATAKVIPILNASTTSFGCPAINSVILLFVIIFICTTVLSKC